MCPTTHSKKNARDDQKSKILRFIISENLRKISNSLVSEIERAIRDLPGSLPARKLLLDRAVEQVKTALVVREKMSANNPNDLDYKIAVADAEPLLGQILVRQNETQTIEKRFRRALEIYEKISKIDADRMQVKILAARARTSLGNFLASKGNFSEVSNDLREAVRFYESIGAGETIDAPLKNHFADSLMKSADALAIKNSEKNLGEAGELYRRSLDLLNDLKDKDALKFSEIQNIEYVSRRLDETKNP